MVLHEVTYINSKAKNKVKQGDQRIIKADMVGRNQIKITLLNEIPVTKPMIYNSLAEFEMDWRLDRSYHTSEEE